MFCYNVLAHSKFDHNQATITDILQGDLHAVFLRACRVNLRKFYGEKTFRENVLEENETFYADCVFFIKLTVFEVTERNKLL